MKDIGVVASPIYTVEDIVSDPKGKATVFMSWNGATDVKSWAVVR